MFTGIVEELGSVVAIDPDRVRLSATTVLADAKVAVSPGIGFGDYGDTHVRFALIENEHRIKQAVRGIKDMLRKDGLLVPRVPDKAAA